jgi:predicted permease
MRRIGEQCPRHQSRTVTLPCAKLGSHTWFGYLSSFEGDEPVADVLVGAYVAVMVSLIALSGWIALLHKHPARRRDARKVLTILVSAGTASGFVGLLIKLHEVGLLR